MERSPRWAGGAQGRGAGLRQEGLATGSDAAQASTESRLGNNWSGGHRAQGLRGGQAWIHAKVSALGGGRRPKAARGDAVG